jgi:hypothetical protein
MEPLKGFDPLTSKPVGPSWLLHEDQMEEMEKRRPTRDENVHIILQRTECSHGTSLRGDRKKFIPNYNYCPRSHI